MFGGLNLYKGENVTILLSTQSSNELLKETGKITDIIIGQGENAVFIELDKRMIINVRYIIKVEIVD